MTIASRFARQRVAPLAAAVVAATLLAGCAAPSGPSGESIAAIVGSPDRNPADRINDIRRKPADMLAFIGVRPGMVALDVSAGRGYTTELIARAVGACGQGLRTERAARSGPRCAGAARRRGRARRRPALRRRRPRWPNGRAIPSLSQIVPVTRSFEDPAPPEVANGGLDLVTLMFNYHDLGHMNVDRAKMNRAIFQALKPGGTYVIADHSGRPGTGISEAGTLHRVEEAFVRQEVEAAGFRMAAQGNFLRNPADPRDRNTPVPAMPKDEFVLKFVKP